METKSGAQNGEQQKGQIQSTFLARLQGIPIVHYVILHVINVTSRLRNINTMTRKVSEMSELILDYSVRVASILMAPFYAIAAAPLAKVDDLATKGLERLERNVPVITKQPEEIVSDTKEIISSRVTPVVKTLENVSENVLSSRPAQITMGVYEKALVGGSAVVNSVLTSDKEANGFPHQKAPDSAARRPMWLASESLYLITNTVNRLFGVVQSRTDSVVQSVRKTL